MRKYKIIIINTNNNNNNNKLFFICVIFRKQSMPFRLILQATYAQYVFAPLASNCTIAVIDSVPRYRTTMI